jgi:hypothetical protein
MIPTLRVLIHMGGLQRLLPFWLAALVLLVLNLSPWLVLAIAYGMVAQFFVEYAMHRFLFHRKPPTEQGIFNQLYRSHIGHHEFPADPELFTGDDHWFPLRFALISTVLHTLALWPFLGLQTGFTTAFVALFLGSASSFAFYEYCHTLAHLNVPKGRFGQWVTRDHLAHHYQDHRATFHVTAGMGWIDRLFGTSHDTELAKTRFDRATMLSMGMDPEDLRLVTARKAYGLPPKPGMKRESQRA